MQSDLQPEETEVRGEWFDNGKQVVVNAACERIEWLIMSRLVRLASDSSGWETLYRDPANGRLWEHTYPHSEWHGAGPPTLRAIPPSEAQSKYGVTA